MANEKRSTLADAFSKIADELEAGAETSHSSDDPRWLKRKAGKFRAMARKREKGLEHKDVQKKRGRPKP